jgi:hypothetical protein
LWLALALHFLPPIIASVLVIPLADLDRRGRSAFGIYLKRMITRSVEAVRLGGDIVMVFGGWYHSPAPIVADIEPH